VTLCQPYLDTEKLLSSKKSQLAACHTTQSLTEVLMDKSAQVEDGVKACLQLMVLLYGGLVGKPGESINKIRYETYSRMAAYLTHKPGVCPGV